MTTPNPRPEFQYGVASVVPADFLNNLDDMLYAYSDSILPTHTGSQVLIQATAGDEAQVAIDRRYFINASSIYEPVAGDPGTYELYAVASYVPTSHATTVKPFDIVVGTEVPADFAYTRHLAKVQFDGSLITDVIQDPHRLNAAQLDGHVASTEPSDGDVVPVASSNAKLARGFRPYFPGVETDLGEVIDYFSPIGYSYPPKGYAFCNGQTLGPTEQDVVPAGSLTLPTLNDGSLIVGADVTKPFGTSSSAIDSAAGAPGMGGGKSSDFGGLGLAHAHAGPAHLHTYPHTHVTPAGLAVFPHFHVMFDHIHALNHHTITHGTWSGGISNPDRPGVDITLADNTDGTTVGNARGTGSSPGVQAATPSTESEAYSSTTDGVASVSDGAPWYQQFARIMRVKEV